MEDNIKIVDIFWERMYLHIIIDGNNIFGKEYVISTFGNKYTYPLYLDLSSHSFTINITNIKDKEMLSNHNWYIKYRNNNFEKEMMEYEMVLVNYEKELLSCTDTILQKPLIPLEWYDIEITLDLGYKFKDLDKIFRYGGTSYAYIFTFNVLERRDKLLCRITPTFMLKNTSPQKRHIKAESVFLKKRIKKRIIYSIEKCINLIYQIASRITPKNGKNILLMSESRVPMGGNLKILNQRMMERKINEKFQISYHFKKTLEHRRLFIFFFWILLALKTARQDYIFVDDYCPFFKYINLHPKTKLIQVWHAGVGFKSVGYARFGEKGSPYPFDSPHRKYDYAIVGGKALKEVYAETFGMNKESCLPYGVIRIDGYMDQNKIENFKKDFYSKHSEFKDKKIILFAPTFRGMGQRSAHYPYESINQSAIYDMCGNEYIFLIKMHPYVRNLLVIESQYSDRIIEFSDFPDINQLFYVTDILITDYSSNIYEFSLHKKPIIFYAFDKEKYELIRSVHRTLDSHAPGKVCITMEEVIQTIKDKDFQLDKLHKFINENFDQTEGYSCDKIIDYIILKNK